MRLMEVSKDREEEFRAHGYNAFEFEYEKGGTPPPLGTLIHGHLKSYGCARDLEVVSVRPSRRLVNTYIVLLRLIDKLLD